VLHVAEEAKGAQCSVAQHNRRRSPTVAQAGRCGVSSFPGSLGHLGACHCRQNSRPHGSRYRL
jgi:hypothetical protein